MSSMCTVVPPSFTPMGAGGTLLCTFLPPHGSRRETVVHIPSYPWEQEGDCCAHSPTHGSRRETAVHIPVTPTGGETVVHIPVTHPG